MGLQNIRVVLVGPLYGGNVGSVCRAMANMGLAELVVADPRPLDLEEARKMACHAGDILLARRECATLAEAVADCGRIYGTSARAGLYRQHARTPRDWAPAILAEAAGCKVALVFGREDNGLTNDELALCTHIIQIPTTELYRSLNLAQAVLVCGYELFTAAGIYEPPMEKAPPAPSELRERMFAMWRDMLLRIGFMQQDKADHMMMGLRRIFGRGVETLDDANIMMGVARQVDWAAGERRAPDAAPGEFAGRS